MSGLRETIRRRGGLELTSRVVGGLEITAKIMGGLWVVGQRTVPSPYNAAATAALMAQFPSQWPTIRDYGFAHPEIVGYMNAYAPEDAKIAISLVPGIGTRWIVGDGSAWINTNMKIYSDIGYEIKADCTGTSYGARLMGASNNSSYYAQVKWVSGNRYHVQTGGGATEQFFTVGTEADIMVDGGSPTSPATVTINGTVVSTTLPRVNPMILMNPFYIFAMNNGSTAADKANCKIAKVALWSATMDTSKDNPYAWFVPFIRNNVNGMLDLVNGTFYQNAGTGQFTISETPSS